MPATMEERLDELLAMSRDVGRLARETAHAEQELAAGRLLHGDKSRHRALMRDLRKEHLRVTNALTGARRRFLADLPPEGAAS